eukprot:SAG22_NODE_5667_length_975_cov_0.860731_2_plen_248_part_01
MAAMHVLQLLNELVAACSPSMQFEEQSNVEVLSAACEAAATAADSVDHKGAAVDATASARLEPPLAMALMLLDRLDLRAPLARAGLTEVAAFMEATDPGPGPEPRRLLQLPVNVSMKEHGERVLGQDTIDGLREACGAGFAAAARGGPVMEGCVLAGIQGDGRDGQWQVVSREVATIPGTTAAQAISKSKAPAKAKGGKAADKKRAGGGKAGASGPLAPADAVYIEGDIPCCILGPGCSAKGGSAGGA